MRRILLMFLLAVPSTAAAQEPLPLDPAVTIGELSNGLRYYIRENRRPENRAELRLVVNAGSILEDEDQRGLAHFVEHMAFNGTTHFDGQELIDFLERSGIRFGPHLNAYTNFDETVYMLRVPSDSAELLATGFQILEDWAHGITFDTTEIRKERGVVIEEWRGGRGAGARLSDQTYPVLFRGSRYAERLPIGTRESLETFDPEALRRFYRDWYRPDLMAVVAVGDFDAAEVERLIRTHFERIPAQKGARPRTEHSIPVRDSAAAVIATDREATGTQVQFIVFQPASEEGTVASFRASLESGLYSQMLNARLSEIARKPDAPFLRASAGTGHMVRGTERFSLGAVVSDTAVARGLEAVLTEVERVERHGFTEAELERAKTNLLRAYERAYEERENFQSSQLAAQCIQHFLNDRPIPGIAAYLELVKELLPGITLEDVNDTAGEWLRRQDRAVVVQAPEKPDVTLPEGKDLLALLATVRRSDIAAYEEEVSDAPLLARALREAAIVNEAYDSLLDATTWTLANGVRVIVKPTDFKADEVLFTAYSPGGTSLVPDSLVTSAEVATQVVMAGGLGEFGAVELRKKLAGVVASAGVTIGPYHEGLSGGASPSDLKKLFELIYLRFTEPRADTAAFEALLSRFRTSVANRSASPEAALQDTVNAIMTQHHPRTRPFTVARVDSIDLDQAMSVYRDRLADASDFTFVFVGSFDVDTLRPLVQRYLGNLPSLDRQEQPRNVGIPLPGGIVEREVRKGIEPRSKTNLIFSGPFEYTAEQRLVLEVLEDVVQLRLREQLREELGGTYGVTGGAAAAGEPDPHYTFSIGFGSAPERVDELVTEVFAQIDSLRQDGPREEDLAKVREMRLRDRETALRHNNFWVSLLSNSDRLGEDPHEVLDLQAQLDRITTESVRRAAETYLDPRTYVMVTLMPERHESGGDETAHTKDGPSSALRVFLECAACDSTEVRQKVPYVSWTVDPEAADVHVAVTEQPDAAGIQFAVGFIGRGQFLGRTDTLMSRSVSKTEDERRAAVLHTVELGLIRYVAATDLGRNIRVNVVQSSQDTTVQPGSDAAQQSGDRGSARSPAPSTAAAQERKPTQQDRRWAAAVDLGFTGSTGNSRLVSLTTGFRVRHLRTTAFKLDWSVNFRYGESRGEVAARHFQSKLNFDLGPASRVAPFFSLTGDRDPFRRLALRTQSGTGVRYGFYKGEGGEASLRAAVLYTHERFTPEADRSPHSDGAWSFKVNANQRLGETIRIENASTFDPVMNDFTDYNLDVTSKLSTRITQNLALTVSHTYAYDSTPVQSVEPADQRVQTGLTVNF